MELKILIGAMVVIAVAFGIVLFRALDPRRKKAQERDAHLPLEGDEGDGPND